MSSKSITASVLFLTIFLPCVPATAQANGPSVSADGRCLLKDGQPFFWLGDTAWFIMRLSDDEIRDYLANRSRKGFTGIQVDLNAYAWADLVPGGEVESPYLDNDPEKPNESYWRRVDRMLDQAALQGLCVLLTPMWGKYYPRYVDGDTGKARRLGNWLGSRYRDRAHVMWFVSGEYDSINGHRPITSAQKTILNAVAQGLEEGHGGRQLMTIHPGGRRDSAVDFHDEDWLDDLEGHAARFFNDGRVHFAAMRPQGRLASTGICLADPGKEYVVYASGGARFTVGLSGAKGRTLLARWYDPTKGKVVAGDKIAGGGPAEPFQPPFAGDAVLHLSSVSQE